MTTLTLRDLGFLGALQAVYTGQYAYSLRGYYTSDPIVIRARRSSDNAESDFYASEITSGALTTWAGSGSAFVKTWYDQSGNNNHFTNKTTAQQPNIVSSGTLQTLNGGLPAIRFSSAQLNGSFDCDPMTAFLVHEPSIALNASSAYYTTLRGNSGIFYGGNVTGAATNEVTTNISISGSNVWGVYNTANLSANTKYLDVHASSNTPWLRRNKLTMTSLQVGTASVPIQSVTSFGNSSVSTAWKCAEIIIYQKTFPSIAAGSEYDQIESSIATYYGV